MTTTDVLGYLNSKGLNFKPVGATEVHMPCFFCGEDPGARGRLYVNVDSRADIPGLFTCHLCGESGSLVSLKRHFGDPTSEKEDEGNHRYEIFQAAARHFHENLSEYQEALAYLKGPERGLTIDTIVSHKLGYAGEEAPLYKALRDQGFSRKDILSTNLCYERDGRVVECFSDHITIPYMTAGNVVTIRGRAWPYSKDDKRPKYKTIPGSEARLFNSDFTWHEKELVICEGEADAMVLEQLGLPAVGVPGAAAWQDSWDGYLADARRLYVVFDRDPAGARGAAKLEEKFGSKVRQIHLSAPGQKIDPTDWVASGHTAEDFKVLLDEANRTGGVLVTVDEAFQEFNEVDDTPGLKFGFELLDTYLDPGLRPSQLMVVLAKTGCLTGDTKVTVSRQGGAVFDIRLDALYATRNASDCTKILRADNGFVGIGEVDEVWHSGTKPVFEVVTRTGRSIKGTGEHPFLTPGGWVKLGDLKSGDAVLVGDLGRISSEEITSITPVGPRRTYDISMKDDPHNFLANGFVVHNTGKTLLLLNLMQRMAIQKGQENMKFLFLSLEQTSSEWFDRARRLHRFYNLNDTDDDARKFWREKLLMSDRNRLSAAEVHQAIDDFDYRMGSPPDVICLDYLGYWARSFKGDEYQRLSDAIMSLKGLAKELRIPIIAPHQVNRGSKDGEAFGSDAGRGCLAGDTKVLLSDGTLIPIKDMLGTERVIAPDSKYVLGEHQCTKAWSQGVQPVLKMVTRGGKVIRATPDHPFMTELGWVNLGDLEPGDGVFAVDEGKFVGDRVGSIEPDGEDEVFDITVPSVHCFTANGLIVSNSGVIEETADFMMGIWSADNALGRNPEEKTGQLTMDILKSRHGGRGQKLKIQFAPLTLAMVPLEDPLASLARDELIYAGSQYRDSWEDALYRHRTGFKGRITSSQIAEQGTL